MNHDMHTYHIHIRNPKSPTQPIHHILAAKQQFTMHKYPSFHNRNNSINPDAHPRNRFEKKNYVEVVFGVVTVQVHKRTASGQ